MPSGVARRPVIGDLRLDDNLVFSVAPSPDAVLHETVPGEPPDQEIGFPVDCAPAAGKCGERQTCAQLLRRARRAGAKRTKADRIAAEAGANVSARVRLRGWRER